VNIAKSVISRPQTTALGANAVSDAFEIIEKVPASAALKR
jgi:hypothetical protein